MTDTPKPSVTKEAHAKAAAVEAARQCYSQGVIGDLIDQAVMGGQIKGSDGPDSNRLHNTCAREMAATAFRKHGVKGSVEDAMQQGYLQANPKPPEADKGASAPRR